MGFQSDGVEEAVPDARVSINLASFKRLRVRDETAEQASGGPRSSHMKVSVCSDLDCVLHPEYEPVPSEQPAHFSPSITSSVSHTHGQFSHHVDGSSTTSSTLTFHPEFAHGLNNAAEGDPCTPAFSSSMLPCSTQALTPQAGVSACITEKRLSDSAAGNETVLSDNNVVTVDEVRAFLPRLAAIRTQRTEFSGPVGHPQGTSVSTILPRCPTSGDAVLAHNSAPWFEPDNVASAGASGAYLEQWLQNRQGSEYGWAPSCDGASGRLSLAQMDPRQSGQSIGAIPSSAHAARSVAMSTYGAVRSHSNALLATISDRDLSPENSPLISDFTANNTPQMKASPSGTHEGDVSTNELSECASSSPCTSSEALTSITATPYPSLPPTSVASSQNSEASLPSQESMQASPTTPPVKNYTGPPTAELIAFPMTAPYLPCLNMTLASLGKDICVGEQPHATRLSSGRTHHRNASLGNTRHTTMSSMDLATNAGLTTCASLPNRASHTTIDALIAELQGGTVLATPSTPLSPVVTAQIPKSSPASEVQAQPAAPCQSSSTAACVEASECVTRLDESKALSTAWHPGTSELLDRARVPATSTASVASGQAPDDTMGFLWVRQGWSQVTAAQGVTDNGSGSSMTALVAGADTVPLTEAAPKSTESPRMSRPAGVMRMAQHVYVRCVGETLAGDAGSSMEDTAGAQHPYESLPAQRDLRTESVGIAEGTSTNGVISTDMCNAGADREATVDVKVLTGWPDAHGRPVRKVVRRRWILTFGVGTLVILALALIVWLTVFTR